MKTSMKKNFKPPTYFTLKKREEEAMKVLWSTDKDLSASEIAEAIPNRNWPVSSIQAVLRSLEKKGAIYVSDITKLGKSYGRLFRPTLSANDYATMQFKHYYQKDSGDTISLISALLGKEDIPKDDLEEVLRNLTEEKK